jgi:hypothetical protein
MFSRDTFVREEIENCSPEESFVVGMRKLMRRWKPPNTSSLKTSLTRYQESSNQVRSFFERAWGVAERNAVKAAKRIGAISYVPPQPTPYGIYVTLTKKD